MTNNTALIINESTTRNEIITAKYLFVQESTSQKTQTWQREKKKEWFRQLAVCKKGSYFFSPLLAFNPVMLEPFRIKRWRM